MECPRCGFVQPEAVECLTCGVVIGKYLATHAIESADDWDISELPGTTQSDEGFGSGPLPPPSTRGPAELADASLLPVADWPDGGVLLNESFLPIAGSDDASAMGMSLASSPPEGPAPNAPATPKFRFGAEPVPTYDLGPLSMGLRSAAALGCLGIAILLLSNGTGTSSVWPFVVTVFFGGAAIWGLATFRAEVSILQFAIEMVVLVVVTLALRSALPAAFSLDVEPPTRANGPAVTVVARIPDTGVGTFAKRALSFTEALTQVLDMSNEDVHRARWDELEREIIFDSLRAAYQGLSRDERAQVLSTWRLVSSFGDDVETLVMPHIKLGTQSTRITIPLRVKNGLAKDLAAAHSAAKDLAQAITVYDTPAP